jgi:hypothetical protein
MNPKNTILMLATILLALALIAPVLAITQNYESAATARIVGNSPEDIVQQLQRTGDINLEKGVYAGSAGTSYSTNANYEIVKKIFSDFLHMLSPGISDIQAALDVNKDSILVINPSNKEPSMSQIKNINSDDMEGISSTLKRNDNLVVLNSPYSGLYIPYEKSFAASVSPYASMIAPMSYSSDMFLKSFLCNLNKYDTIGEAYRQARNNYYWNTNDKNELIGLTLMSYMLYGMPTQGFSAPAADLSTYCKDYQKYFDTSSQSFSISSAASPKNDMIALTETSGVYEKNTEFRINSYNVVQDGNYSLIETDTAQNSMNLFELVLPSKTMAEEFPMNTIITGFNVTELSDPVDLTISDLPEFDGFNYIDRECYEDSKEAGIEFSKAYAENSMIVLARINPVEVVNCTEGKFRLYKTVKYKIEYFPYSPVLIESVNLPDTVLPEETINLSANLQNIQTSPVAGYLAVKDENGNIINAKEINADTGTFSIDFNAPEKEGFYTYRLDFYQGNESNESVTYKDFSFSVVTIELALITPEVATSQADVTVVVFSNLNNTFDTKINYDISNNNNIESSQNKDITINPGLNVFTLHFDNLDRNKILYDVLVGVPYSNDYKTATASILTEHIPIIIQNNIKIKENESLNLTPQAYDLDNDSVTLDIKYPFTYSQDWKASFESSGIYEINITANDGIKQSMKTILLEIGNVNRQPNLQGIDNVTIKEGESITISPAFSDPDNLNSVTNDDNNLTISYSELFDENNSLNANFESSGTYTVYATVSDGEATDTKAFNLEIRNTNREPVFSTNNITIHENETLNINEIVFDPDNNNSVTNDDNNLSVITDKLFDANGIWQTDFNDSGSYNVNINVSDGEFTKSETVSINVINVNRAPQISSSARETYYIDENSNLSLEVSASDPDGDNIETKWYVNNIEKAQSNAFMFKPESQTGNFEIKAIASDGDLSATRTVNVIVSDVPVLSGFDGSTSVIDKTGLSSVYPFILEKAGKARIMFKQPVDLTKTVDFINTVSLDASYVSLDSNFLDALKGIPAHVTLYNIVTTQNPVIYYDEQFAKNKASVSRVCPSSICSNIVYSNTTLDFDVSHFSTFTVNDSSQKQSDISTLESITLDVLPGSKGINQSFTIQNTGLADLDNLQIEGIFNASVALSIIPQQLALPSQQSATLYITGSVPMLSSWEAEKIGEIKLKDSNFEHTIQVYLKQKETFYLKRMDISNNGEVYSYVMDDNVINLTRQNIGIRLDIASLYQEDENTTPSSNVKIKISIEDSNGKEVEKYSKSTNIDAGETVHKDISLNLPEILGKYMMTVRLESTIGDATYTISSDINLNLNELESEESSSSQAVKFTGMTSSDSETVSLTENTSEPKLNKKIIIWMLVIDAILLFLIVIVLLAKLARNKVTEEI